MPEKKPPIDIEEIEEDEEEQVKQPVRKEKAQQGPLTYGASSGKSKYRDNGKPSFSLTTALAGACIGLALSVLASYFLTAGVSKDVKAVFDRFLPLENQVASINTKVDGDQKTINNVVSSLAEYSRKTDLNNYALKSEVKPPDMAPYALKSQLPDSSTLVVKSSLDAQVKSLQDQITALKAPVTNGAGTVTGSVRAELKQYGDIILPGGAPTSPTTLNGAVRLTLTNTSNVEIDDVVVTMTFIADRFMTNSAVPPVALVPTTPSLLGGPSFTRILKADSTGFAFSTPITGIKLRAGEIKKYYLALSANYATSPAWDIFFEPEVEVDY